MKRNRRRDRVWIMVLSLCAIGAVACVGTMEERFPTAALGPDGGPGGDPGACDEPVATLDNGHHKPGEACLTCHTQGGSGPAFTIGGTLYDAVGGQAPVSGATIHMVDANGADVAIVTADNGNFWSTRSFAFPLTTYASSCPGRANMITPLTESGGDCNSAGCHTSGFRVYLP